MGTSLFKKLVKVLAEIERIPKSGRNKFHGYDYVTEGDLVDHIRPKLADAGVFLFTSIDSVSAAELIERKNSEGRIVNVATVHTFVCSETGESFSVKGAGCGEDSGDKALYKAITGAEKYMLMKNFLVATGDDPEVDSPAVKTTVAAPVPPPSMPVSDIRWLSLVEVKKDTRDGKDLMVYKVKEGKKEYEATCWEPEVWKIVTTAMESGERVKATVRTKDDKVKIVAAVPESSEATYKIKESVNPQAEKVLKGAETKIANMMQEAK